MATASDTPRMALAPRRDLFGGAIQFDHGRVDVKLVFGIHAADSFEDFAIDGFDCLLDTLAKIALAAVTQFDSFMRASRRARGNGGAAKAAVFEMDVDFDGRVAPAVENFAADDVDDCSHDLFPASNMVVEDGPVIIHGPEITMAGPEQLRPGTRPSRKIHKASVQRFATASNASSVSRRRGMSFR